MRCKKLGFGEAGAPSGPMEVRFRVTPEGKVTEVRIEPRGFDDVPAFGCMARAVEGLRFSAGAAEPFRFPLP
jgi:hypothetical protein